ncbi:UDP-N-acetylglucosamine transferase subunit ALG13-like [Convolutriloba macropyga]|uniref:UDP-N-acetylglucosamine transferase subunit ALG13-like n=1 Tax=Convolutriloba macropyga TaxID=536237 RepID=UPI003F524C5E
MKEQKGLFITVGSTQFDKLMQVLCNEQSQFLDLLSKRGFRSITVQYGKGLQPKFDDQILQNHHLTCELYDYRDSIIEDIQNSDLIISHAGAGTCLEVLNNQKPLIVVVNDTLMHNHQAELANQLTRDGHCLSCTPETLIETMEKLDESLLKPFEPGRPELFVQCLNKYFGIASQ